MAPNLHMESSKLSPADLKRPKMSGELKLSRLKKSRNLQMWMAKSARNFLGSEITPYPSVFYWVSDKSLKYRVNYRDSSRNLD